MRDSKNVQALHLTGNYFRAHDRLLMRAILSCKTKWPLPPNFVPKFEKISSSDKVTLVMLNLCFMLAIPPDYMAELGLTEVNNVHDVRQKIRSFERRRLLEDEIKWKHTKEFLKTEVHNKDLLAERAMEADQRLTELTREEEVRRLADEEQNRVQSGYEMFDRYYNDPEARIYDMFQMIDFYGLKRKLLELQVSLTPEDEKLRQLLPLTKGHKMMYRKNELWQAEALSDRQRNDGLNNRLT